MKKQIAVDIEELEDLLRITKQNIELEKGELYDAKIKHDKAVDIYYDIRDRLEKTIAKAKKEVNDET